MGADPDWVIVFDLDDTLISEFEYQRSGIAAVESYIVSVFGVDFDGCIQAAFDSGVKDLWGWTCQRLGLPADVKQSFLWVYRLHSPNLKLVDGVEELLSMLRAHGAHLAVLSDGRSVTQRLKLRSVGLAYMPAYISEDYGSLKPCRRRFLAIEERWPHSKYVYIGDNPEKDFKAPVDMEWFTIGASWVRSRVHQSFDLEKYSYCEPHVWCDNPFDVFSLIARKV
tara:strand:+ start:166 stop:837 length:672 start_codon:yes stop_codon:yes gene_type:complete